MQHIDLFKSRPSHRIQLEHQRARGVFPLNIGEHLIPIRRVAQSYSPAAWLDEYTGKRFTSSPTRTACRWSFTSGDLPLGSEGLRGRSPESQ